MSTLGYVDLLRLLDEVNRIGQTQSLKVALDSFAGPSMETAAAGAPAGRGEKPTFDVIRTQSLLYEETQRLRNQLLSRLDAMHRVAQGGAAARIADRAPAPPDSPRTWSADEIIGLLNDAQMAILKYPTAAQAAFSAVVREGRRYAETDEGKAWLDALSTSGLMRRARWLWETTSLNMLQEDESTIVPSTYLEALLRAAEVPDMEELLGRVKGMGHE